MSSHKKHGPYDSTSSEDEPPPSSNLSAEEETPPLTPSSHGPSPIVLERRGSIQLDDGILKQNKQLQKQRSQAHLQFVSSSLTRDKSQESIPYHKVNIKFHGDTYSEEDVETTYGLRVHLRMRYKYLYQQQHGTAKDGPLVLPLPEQAKKRFANAKAVLQDGVYRVVDGEKGTDLVPIQSVSQFHADLDQLWAFAKQTVVKDRCFKRLSILEQWNELHSVLNRNLEEESTMDEPTDFFDVSKVDTHIHLDASYTAQHLLQFMKRKLELCSEDVVEEDKDGQPVTLGSVFKELGLSKKCLTVDKMNVSNAHKMYHRFDNFNNAYNPFGQERLRTIFMSTSNLQKGKYFAEIISEVFEKSKKSGVKMEPRITLFGRYQHEWNDLAEWTAFHGFLRDDVRWVVQVPRIYQLWKQTGDLESFQDMIDNTFRPLFEATLHPETNPVLTRFLEHVVAFDSVDDESKFDVLRVPNESFLPPSDWKDNSPPPYSYYMYYTYANLYTLNVLREIRGMSTFSLRPHAGESGPTHHLATAFLLARSVNHGINLMSSPTLQYLYYLSQIGLAMSPISNNNLFLPLADNPFETFFKRGLLVTLSTDDPMQFHSTSQPLMEEYTVAKQFWKLTSTDMCELARNSVLQSGFPFYDKRRMLGPTYYLPGPEGNTVSRTNISNIRISFRHEVLQHELKFVWRASSQRSRLSSSPSLASSLLSPSDPDRESSRDDQSESEDRPPRLGEDDVVNWIMLCNMMQHAVCIWVAEKPYNLPDPITGTVEHPEHLSLDVGHSVFVTKKSRHAGPSVLWRGRDSNGKEGLFPPDMGYIECLY